MIRFPIQRTLEKVRVLLPHSWSPYVYFMNNPMRFIDPTGKDGWDILSGIGDAIYNNFSWGATDLAGLNKEPYQVISSADYNTGRSIGDCMSVVAGVLEVVTGGVAAGGGTATSPTGVGVGVAVVGGAAIVHGTGAITKALQGEGRMSEMKKSESSGGNKDEPKGRSGKTIAEENGVSVKSYGTNDVHKPAHAHIKGGGKEVRVGANGKPLKGQPNLSDNQRSVVNNNIKNIRKEVNKVGKANKAIEEYNKTKR